MDCEMDAFSIANTVGQGNKYETAVGCFVFKKAAKGVKKVLPLGCLRKNRRFLLEVWKNCLIFAT